MPGVQINQLPLITVPSGQEVMPVETPDYVTKQISLVNLAAYIAALVLTPIAIDAPLPAGLNSNINPAGLATAGIIRVTSPGNAALSIDGIQAPVGSTFLYIVNANTAIGGALTLVDASGSASLAANRILTQAGAGLTILFNVGVLLWYDPEVARWRIM